MNLVVCSDRLVARVVLSFFAFSLLLMLLMAGEPQCSLYGAVVRYDKLEVVGIE